MSKIHPYFNITKKKAKKTSTASANENEDGPPNTSQTTTKRHSERNHSECQPKRLAILPPEAESPCISSSPSPSSIIAALDKRKPLNPKLDEYPKTRYGKESYCRAFSKQWYVDREWLE